MLIPYQILITSRTFFAFFFEKNQGGMFLSPRRFICTQKESSAPVWGQTAGSMMSYEFGMMNKE